MNKGKCFTQIGIGLLLLPTSLVGAQGVGGENNATNPPATPGTATPDTAGVPAVTRTQDVEFTELNWYFQGSGGLGGGFGGGGLGNVPGGGFGREALKHALSEDRRAKYLTALIDVQLNKATVQQAAAALAKASGLAIAADDKYAPDKRLSVDARSVPLEIILEALAVQTDLMIVRNGDGVALRPWPSITINGQKGSYRGASGSWADEWMKPQYPPNKILYLNAKGDPVTAGSMEAAGLEPLGGSASGGLQGTTAAPLSMTISGDRLVVAEPAAGPKGEAGYRITIYNLAVSPMKMVNSVFHASPRSGRPLPGSSGGGFGGGASGGFGGGASGGGFGGGGGGGF